MAVINDAGLKLIKEFEGFEATAYRDIVGVWTIGYGTTAAAGVGIAPYAGLTISEAEATRYLLLGVEKFATHIRPLLKRTPTENQWAAMLSLAYNIGPGAFAKSSVLRFFNAGDTASAANAFAMWNKAGGKVVNGLVRRRAAEKALFLTPGAPVASTQTPPAVAPAAVTATGNWLTRLLASIFGGSK